MSDEKGGSQAFLALQKIKEAEQEARRIIQEARESIALKVIQEADDEAKKIKEDYLLKEKKKADEKKNVIIQQAVKEAEGIKKTAEEEAAILRERARAAMPEAVEEIAEKIRVYLQGESV